MLLFYACLFVWLLRGIVLRGLSACAAMFGAVSLFGELMLHLADEYVPPVMEFGGRVLGAVFVLAAAVAPAMLPVTVAIAAVEGFPVLAGPVILLNGVLAALGIQLMRLHRIEWHETLKTYGPWYEDFLGDPRRCALQAVQSWGRWSEVPFNCGYVAYALLEGQRRLACWLFQIETSKPPAWVYEEVV